MKQCIYSRCKLNKCSEICHTCNFSCYNVAYCKILCCIYPWICLRELQAECNFCITLMSLMRYFQLISNMEYFLWIIYSCPRTSLRYEEDRLLHLRSTNAPKSVTFLTVPSTASPTCDFANTALSAFQLAQQLRSCLLSPITRFLLGLNSLITNSIS